jgi:hypothetical protein
MVVQRLRDPIRCGLLVMTWCATLNPKTGMHQTLLMSGFLLGSCHQIHGHAHTQGNHLADCALVVQLMFAGVQSQQLGLLDPVLETGLPVHWCNCWQRVMQS